MELTKKVKTKRIEWLEAMADAMELKDAEKVKALCYSVVDVMENSESCCSFCPFCPTCDWIENITGRLPSDFND